LCPEELERDNRAVWVVLIAYGCGFGLRARSGVLGELRGGEDTEVRTAVVLMEEDSKFKYFNVYHWSPVTGRGYRVETMGGFCYRDGSDGTVDPRDNVGKVIQKESKKVLSINRIE